GLAGARVGVGISGKQHLPWLNGLGAKITHDFPGILRQALANGLFGLCLDYVQDALPITERTTPDNEAAFGEVVHERSMLRPRLLLGHLTIGSPLRTADADDCEQTLRVHARADVRVERCA